MWASCFLAFMATSLDQQDARGLAAYGMIVLQLAWKHGSTGWLFYDCQFRQHKAAGAVFPWADINLSITAATVLNQAGDGSSHSYPLCLSSDHFKKDCALLPLEQLKPRPPLPCHSHSPLQVAWLAIQPHTSPSTPTSATISTAAFAQACPATLSTYV